MLASLSGVLLVLGDAEVVLVARWSLLDAAGQEPKMRHARFSSETSLFARD
jgi:hypothetical protein